MGPLHRCAKVGFVCLLISVMAGGCTPMGPADNTNDNGSAGGTATWQAVLDIPAAALLAVTGRAADDVYVVGADDGSGSIFLHYDGTNWTRLDIGATEALWWITPELIDGNFYATGDGGQIIRFDPDTQATEFFATPGTERVFGLWGLSSDNLWAVVSDTTLSSGGGEIWHYDGTSWSIVDTSNIDPEGLPGLIKIWGRSNSEIYAVGSLRTLLTYDGNQWTEADIDSTSATTRTLFSVYGNTEFVATCGGFQDGLILERTGTSTTFTDATLLATFTPQMNGIIVADDGQAVAVGQQLSVAFRTDAGWELQTTGLEDPLFDHHGPWIDPDGGVWVTGGNIVTAPFNNGVLQYYGTETVTTDAF